MKADASAQQLLLDLQKLDTTAAQLDHRERTLVEQQELLALRTRIQRIHDEHVAAVVIAADLARDQARADADVEQVRERSRKDQHLLDSGTIGDPKQLQNLQHELQSLARRQSDLEDVELEIMERVDGAQAAVALLAEQHAEATAQEESLAAQVDALVAEIDAQRQVTIIDRSELASRVPADLLALYEKVRADHDGVGAAHLHRGQCGGCRLQLPPNEIERLRAIEPDEVVRCEECRRILVRTAESGL
ncbi:MAG: C4-type zinc ribbon domain-containing protein [Candidatus Nanopelagicales bacterium]|nr:C4-type zinc ribbon domain-containing protein [Candidatus Nanopelagicales bacterium]